MVKVALVTGCSSGIGQATCRALSKEPGWIVVGCARRVSTEEVSPTLFHVRSDLRQTDQTQDLFDLIDSRFGRLDLTVLNAGITNHHTLMDAQVEDWRAMLEVNVLAVSQCAQLAIKAMKGNPMVLAGQIIFINSMSGHTVHPHPRTRFYSATKFGVTGLIQAWRDEVAEMKLVRPIRVCSISPRLVDTEFVMSLYPEAPEMAQKILDTASSLQPEDVAQQVLHIIHMPIHVQIHDILMSPTQKVF
eukprot:maker-scaffold1191_size56271-snap-gene-0.13 protein:Tk11969 transcript:maker-scaffold1191_size56271-snap-gene-0.13-mRNA-1 annotation:"dehydrogenase reductase sdr family member 11"